jgi:3-mercaptopyruvate sulfurtransferase SseA
MFYLHKKFDIKFNMKCLSRFVELMSVLLLVLFIAASAAFAGDAVQSRVTTQWVADNIHSVKIIDLRYKKYAEAHIPGAVQMKWGDEVFAQDAEYMLPPNLSETKRIINTMGLIPGDHIVLYDGEADNRQVMRMYWALKYWNFPKVSIIKGGLALWEKENRPVVDSRLANKNEN